MSEYDANLQYPDPAEVRADLELIDPAATTGDDLPWGDQRTIVVTGHNSDTFGDDQRHIGRVTNSLVTGLQDQNRHYRTDVLLERHAKHVIIADFKGEPPEWPLEPSATIAAGPWRTAVWAVGGLTGAQRDAICSRLRDLGAIAPPGPKIRLHIPGFYRRCGALQSEDPRDLVTVTSVHAAPKRYTAAEMLAGFAV